MLENLMRQQTSLCHDQVMAEARPFVVLYNSLVDAALDEEKLYPECPHRADHFDSREEAMMLAENLLAQKTVSHVVIFDCTQGAVVFDRKK